MPWQVLHGDNKRKHYWWLTRQLADRSSTTPHPFGVQTYMTPTTEKSNTHRTRLLGSLLAVTRCPVLITYIQKLKMLKVMEHSDLLYAQYLARSLEPENVCHFITRDTPKRHMEETLFIRHRSTVETMIAEKDRKATLQALHTDAVIKAVKSHDRNIVLDGRPPPISNSEKDLTMEEHSTLAQLRAGYCRLLGPYKSRIKKDTSINVCADCGMTPHDIKHLIVCPPHLTTDLWRRPAGAVRKLSKLEARDTEWNEHGLKGEQQQQQGIQQPIDVYKDKIPQPTCCSALS